MACANPHSLAAAEAAPKRSHLPPLDFADRGTSLLYHWFALRPSGLNTTPTTTNTATTMAMAMAIAMVGSQ